jgi:alpha-L-fucosidase 2
MKGNLVATRHGAGNTLVEFENDGNVAQGNYIAVVIKGSRQKVLRVRAGF